MPSQRELFQRMAEQMPHAVVVVDQNDSKVMFANSDASAYFGFGDMTGMELNSLIKATEDGHGWDFIRDQILGVEAFEGTVHVMADCGILRTCNLKGFTIGDEEDLPPAVVLIFRDIAQETHIASELERKNLEMAKINSELIRSNAELKRVSELKSNFLSIASHELKTPLTSIKGYSEIITENFSDKVEDSVLRMIESINRAADRLHKVINNMLDVSRIEQKRLRLHPEKLDLGAAATDCIEELSQFSSRRGIEFECNFPEELPFFHGDKMRMQQVFTNLFSNALKYSPNGANVKVSLSVEDNERFHLVVQDRGIGIDAHEQKKIFDPFYEIGSAYRHSSDGDTAKFMGGGTGLGLSIVKGIVERHGGRIWVESEGMSRDTYPGSKFHVVLPLESKIHWDDDETKTVRTADGDSFDQAILPELQPEPPADVKPKILLIDDDREAIEIARMVLESAFEIVVASSGEEGLSLAFSGHPALILLDLYLPGLDGARVCRILRTQEETRDLPIAFFSAGTQSEEMQKAFASGADDFIVKPFSGRELVEKIWRLLMKKKEDESYR